MKTIKLGHKYPTEPLLAESIIEEGKDEERVIYPSIYISEAGKDAMGMPDEGTATVKYRVRSKTLRDSDGKKSCELEIEVMSIKPHGSAEVMDNSTRDSDDAIDDYFKEKDGGSDEE